MSKEEKKRAKLREKVAKEHKKRSDKIPTVAVLNEGQDRFWDYIPLGICLDKDYNENILAWKLRCVARYENEQDYYDSLPSTSLLIAGGTGSGKTVLERGIVNHISNYRSKFQLIGSDVKRIEFCDIKDKFNGVTTDIIATASVVAKLQKMMMSRFKMMENSQVNSIWKIDNQSVDCDFYKIKGIAEPVQFDEFLAVGLELDENDRKYTRLKEIYPEGVQPVVMTAEDIYKMLKDGDRKSLTVKGQTITKTDIKQVKGKYSPKAIIFMIDDLNEVMCDDDYKSVDTIKSALGSIARLGRASGIHLCLCCHRASGSTISTDLKNNIQMSVLLGGFDDGASCLMFEKDISNWCRPEIKGRGFVATGTEIVEMQTFVGGISYF